MKLKSIHTLVLLCLLFCGACSESGEDGGGGDGSSTTGSSTSKDGNFTKQGAISSFEYRGYEPLKNKPITVYYYIPTEDYTTGVTVTDMPVLFSMHGAERSGNSACSIWAKLAEAYKFIVIAPEYSKTHYNENAYQFGGVQASKSATMAQDRSLWTYNTIESIFDYFKKETGSSAKAYYLFGHSAGGQFVGRFMMAMPDARVIRGVAANPSSWAWPYIDGLTGTDGKNYDWGYSVKGTPMADYEALKVFFAKKLIVMAGTNDVVADSYLDDSAAANAQGKNRFERAQNFYNVCTQMAKDLNAECNMKLGIVEGVAHSSTGIIYGYKSPSTSNVEKRGDVNAYDMLFNAVD